MPRMCHICGEREATYVCSKCGRVSCAECFNDRAWACASCYGKRQPIRGSLLEATPALKLLMAGIGLIIVGSVLLMATALVTATTGGVFMFFLGPIPILFSSGISPAFITVLAVILAIAVIALTLAFLR